MRANENILTFLNTHDGEEEEDEEVSFSLSLVIDIQFTH